MAKSKINCKSRRKPVIQVEFGISSHIFEDPVATCSHNTLFSITLSTIYHNSTQVMLIIFKHFFSSRRDSYWTKSKFQAEKLLSKYWKLNVCWVVFLKRILIINRISIMSFISSTCSGIVSLCYSGNANLGPVVQSVVSLTSSLRVILLTVLADSIYNILIFLLKKCE